MNTHDKFVASHTVGSLLTEFKQQLPELIDISAESTVEEAFDILLANDITSVPVYRIQDDTKEYITIVNTLDLLRFTIINVSSSI
ncbi:hypothetical protein BC937DRAFT_94931 [Endogone sp. FLAS-F59071]|nr:hypothetical protein BC937DRAFT_94931 [Endogone sp. FLAS-F59071]|eukprot:RUS13688.1 hypothetical protein BC937DRAFT_94931 [Endogone sp. FLAS-F59071]